MQYNALKVEPGDQIISRIHGAKLPVPAHENPGYLKNVGPAQLQLEWRPDFCTRNPFYPLPTPPRTSIIYLSPVTISLDLELLLSQISRLNSQVVHNTAQPAPLTGLFPDTSFTVCPHHTASLFMLVPLPDSSPLLARFISSLISSQTLFPDHFHACPLQ